MKTRINLLKTGLCALVLFGLGIGSCGVSTNIFNNTTVGQLHPCGIALANLTTVGTSKDCPVAICTYEGENTPGYVFVWKSCKALLNSAASGNGMSSPDYEITGIADPEAVAFDTDSNLYISSPSNGAIHYINYKTLMNSATSSGNGVPALDASKLGVYYMPSTLPSEPTTTYTDTYSAPRGLTFDADDGKLYVVMENYTRSYNNPNTPAINSSAVLQITNPASANPVFASVSGNFSDADAGTTTGQPNDVAGNCLDITYSHAHQCFFLTDLFNQRLHQLNWPSGTSATNTSGANLAEPTTSIVLQGGQYCVGVGLSDDPNSQDSIYCTSSDLATNCQLNAFAYSQWNTYVNGAAPSSVRKLDAPTLAAAPQFDVGNFVSWGVEVMPYLSNGRTILHGILVADAQQNKVVSFSTP